MGAQKPLVVAKIEEAKEKQMMPMMVLMPVIAQIVTPIISKYGEPKFSNPMMAVMTVMGMADQDEALKAGVTELQRVQTQMAMGNVPDDAETEKIMAMVNSL